MAEELKKIKVSVTNKGLEAYINVPSPSSEQEGVKALTIDDARNALQSAGVIEGIIETELERIFKESLFDRDILVARGIPAKDGEDSRLDYLFQADKESGPKEDEDGRIDYKELSFLINVAKGDNLCLLHPPTPGEPGKTVTGEVIKQREGLEKKSPQGPNTEFSPQDPNLLIASSDGCVSVSKSGLIEVKSKHDIKGDVNFSTGNINIVGSLVVRGDIKSGFKVKVTGDLEVGGCIEDAEIEVGGDLLVKKGFLGRGKGIIRSQGNVTIKFVQGQQIFCGGDLTVGGELMHTKTRVNGNVLANSSKGAIIGGIVEAEGSIEATQIGNLSYSQTEIIVGANFKLQERLLQIDEEIEKLKVNQEKVKNALYNLSRLRIQLKGNLPPAQQTLFERLQETNRYYPQYQQNLLKEREQIEKEISAHKDSYVRVNKNLFPGVKVIIGKIPRIFNDKITHTTLREIKNEIVESV